MLETLVLLQLLGLLVTSVDGPLGGRWSARRSVREEDLRGVGPVQVGGIDMTSTRLWLNEGEDDRSKILHKENPDITHQTRRVMGQPTGSSFASRSCAAFGASGHAAATSEPSEWGW